LVNGCVLKWKAEPPPPPYVFSWAVLFGGLWVVFCLVLFAVGYRKVT
jgi:hypothetical protein